MKLIAVAGPTASGKSTLAHLLANLLGKDKSIVIAQDNYYKDWSHLPKERRKKINFDDPRSFDMQLFTDQLQFLKKNLSVATPTYDFVQSKRLKKTQRNSPKEFIIVEGLMPVVHRPLHQLFDCIIYVDADEATCLSRRLLRDTKERGETVYSVCRRYLTNVLPMQKRYVKPQRRWADAVVDGSKRFDAKMLSTLLRRIKR